MLRETGRHPRPAHRDIELGAPSPPRAGLLGGTGPRIEETAVLVDVRKDQVGIVLEAVEHAVAVMRVDVDIGHPPQTVSPAQELDHDAAVVVDAEPGGVLSAGMVQSRDRHESSPERAVHDPLHRRDRCPDDSRARDIDTRHRGRIAIVQEAVAGRAALGHEVEIVGRVEGEQLASVGRICRGQRDPSGHAAILQLGMEGVVTVRAERVTVPEPVGGNVGALEDENRGVVHDRRL